MSFRVQISATAGDLELDVDLDGDDVLVVVGPNGSGKSTLLRAIAGAHPARGEVEVTGRHLLSDARAIDLAPEERNIGYVPQGYGLFPHLSALDNVAFGLRCRGVSKAERRQRAADLLSDLGCGAVGDRFPSSLSGGEAQRVALARALVVEPQLLLLDEPLAALDAGARREVREFLTDRLRAMARPSIVVTHDVRDLMALRAPIAVLERGEVVQRGSLEQLRAEPATAFVAELVG